MLLTFTAITFFILGREISLRLWRNGELAGAERITAATSIAFAIWLGTLWAFALTGTLTATALAIRNIVAAAAAATMWLTRWRSAPDDVRRIMAAGALAPLLPLVLWVSFIGWRGSIVPPLSHDVLAYHLPKAVFYIRAEGYDALPAMPARARNIPVNYELLLADAVLIDGDDTFSEWLSLLHYLTFIAAGVALAQRWWRTDRIADMTVALLLAGIPVALLHSGAHKNDLMTAAFMTAAMVWIGRFLSTSELRSLMLGAATLAMAFGTKPQASVLALAAMPFVLWRLARGERRAARIAAIAAASLAFAALLGFAYWPIDRAASLPSPQTGAPAPPFRFGDWENFWQVPYVLIAAPFSRSAMSINVPWSDTPWFWRRYEIYFSELGIPFAVCALLLPFAIWRLRNVSDGRTERIFVSIVAAMTFASMMPIVFRPLGMYAISAPRYVLFVVPLVFAWTIAPLLRAGTRSVRMSALAAAIVIFGAYAVLAAMRDTFVPPSYIAYAAQHPGTRVIPFDPNRGASLVDRAGGPEDRVIIEAADGTWLYPAFGASLEREVILVRAGSPAQRLPEAEWIVIDRKFAAVWKHPRFQTLGEARQYILRGGGASLESDPLIAAILADGRWRLMYSDAPSGQALFQRR